MRLFVALIAALLLAMPSAQAAGPRSDQPGPPFHASKKERLSTLACEGDLVDSERRPVLLIHGTSVTSEEHWGATYLPALLKRGHSVCTIDLVDYGYADVQVTVERVASAIRYLGRHSDGRKIAILGHSQGAFQAFFALRIWPALKRYVDDVIGLAGAYDRGSESIRDDCRSEDGCVPAFHQIATGSRFLKALKRYPLPAGPSYTTIGTLADSVITPQPAANRQPGAHAVEIQDVCPGRRSIDQLDHILMAGDAVAYALVIDALDHRGTASVERIDPAVCGQMFFAGVKVVQFLFYVPSLITRKGATTQRPPRLRCYLRPRCAKG